MKYLISAAVLFTASPITAQEPVVERVEEVEGGTIIRMSQTFQFPAELGPAMIPYIDCLANGVIEQPDDNWVFGQRHEKASLIKANCRGEKEDGIFLAATVLESLGQLDLSARRDLIFLTIAAIEESQFVAPEMPDVEGVVGDSQ